jgi:hypothetical protein
MGDLVFRRDGSWRELKDGVRHSLRRATEPLSALRLASGDVVWKRPKSYDASYREDLAMLEELKQRGPLEIVQAYGPRGARMVNDFYERCRAKGIEV